MNPLDQIRADVALIADDDIAIAARALDPPKKDETELKALASEEAKRYWALAHRYDGQAHSLSHAAIFQSRSDDERQRLMISARRIGVMAALARDVAWILARDETGDAAWNARSIGMRANFTLVVPPEGQGGDILAPITALRKALGSQLGLPDEADDEEPKVQ